MEATARSGGVFWPCFVAEMAAVDEVGESLSNNELFAFLLDQGVIKAHRKIRLAESLTFPECLIADD